MNTSSIGKAMGSSPTKLTLAYLRERGWHCEVVEHWNPKVCIKNDLWGFADIAAKKKGEVGTLLVQCTSWSHVNTRVAKILALPKTPRLCLESGDRIWVIGWVLRDVSGSSRNHGRKIYDNRLIDIKLADLPAEGSEPRVKLNC